MIIKFLNYYDRKFKIYLYIYIYTLFFIEYTHIYIYFDMYIDSVNADSYILYLYTYEY